MCQLSCLKHQYSGRYITLWAHNNLHIAAQRDDEIHQFFDRKTIEPVIDQRRNLGLRHAEQLRGDSAKRGKAGDIVFGVPGFVGEIERS
jgi:hypothetical protein